VLHSFACRRGVVERKDGIISELINDAADAALLFSERLDSACRVVVS
jgi:hypothetical protein